MYIPLNTLKQHDFPDALDFDFRRFKLSDRKWYEPFAAKFSPVSCEYNFANLFAWQEPCQFSWAMFQGRVLVLEEFSGICLMPLGPEMEPAALAALLQQLNQAGRAPSGLIASADYPERFPETEAFFDITQRRDLSEYLYDTSHLVDLTGTRLHKKRNLISQFRRANENYKIESLNDLVRQQALDLSRAMLERFDPPAVTLEQEYQAIQKSFDHFEQLGLEGLALTIGGRVVAYSVFSRLNADIYDIQFEKADSGFKGAAQVINQETARYLKDKCRFINREQDLGVNGLRQSKLSYDPVRLVHHCQLTVNHPD